MKHIIVTQCPVCERYKTDDGDYRHLDIHEQAMLILSEGKYELKAIACRECKREYADGGA